MKINILKHNTSTTIAFTILLVFLFSNSSFAFLDADALPFNNPLDDSDQSICYFLQELDEITIDGEKNKSATIRGEVNKAAQHFSDNTNMSISDEPCNTLRTNMIRSANLGNEFADGTVDSFPSNSNPSYKHIVFNTLEDHPYSTRTTCFTLFQDPNLRYIANHEFGHFAGLDHINENNDSNNDFMSRDCNRAYSTLPQNYKNDINALYPIDATTPKTDDIAVFRNGAWFIDTDNNGTVDITKFFGTTGDVPLVGDYNGDGTDDLVAIRAGTWYIDTDRNGAADITVPFGDAGDIPLVGDFNTK